MPSRRDFLTTATAAAGASVLAGGLLVGRPAPVQAAKAAKITKGHVVQISDERMTAKDKPVVEIASKMLDRAMQEFTGKKKAADAWASLFTAKDKVGIKINCLGKPCMSTTPEVVKAIIAGLTAAGVPEGNIIVFDLFPSHMAMSRYRLGTDPKGVRYLAHRKYGFAEEWTKHPSGKVKLAKALLEVDKVVSVPIIKDHAISGVTCALKNMAFGCVNNPEAHHRNGCDPGIANIYNLPEIKDRTSLIVLDAAFLQYDGGPQCKPAARVAHNTLMVTTDAVALDKLVWEELDARRKVKRLPALAKSREPKHIATAAGLGLGTDDRSKIKVVKAKI